jgi:hypothetical protein
VTGADRVSLLLRHVRTPVPAAAPGARAERFDRLGRLAKSIPVRRLAVPDCLAGMDAVCRALVEDAGAVIDR